MKIKLLLLVQLLAFSTLLFSHNTNFKNSHLNPSIQVTIASSSFTKGTVVNGNQLSLNNNTGSPIQNATYRLKSTNQLFITAIQSNVNCAYTLANDKSYVDIQIPSLPNGQTATINFSLVSGYCFSIPPGGQITISNYLSICNFNTNTNICEGASLPVVFTPTAISVESSSSFASTYDLLEFMDGVLHTATTPLQANQGKIITRFYLLKNNSPVPLFLKVMNLCLGCPAGDLQRSEFNRSLLIISTLASATILVTFGVEIY